MTAVVEAPCEGRCHHCGAGEDEECYSPACPCWPWSVGDGPSVQVAPLSASSVAQANSWALVIDGKGRPHP